MGDNRNTSTNRPSCPYPVSAGHFPMPANSDNSIPGNQINNAIRTNIDEPLPIEMRSPYATDYIVNSDNPACTGIPANVAGTVNVHHNTTPSAPSIDEISTPQRIPYPPGVGFTDLLANQAEMPPCNPPPSYDELFAPKNVTQPRSLSNCANPRITTSPSLIVVPRSVSVSGNRIINHPPAQLVGVRSNSTNNGVGGCLMLMVVLFVALVFLIMVLANTRHR